MKGPLKDVMAVWRAMGRIKGTTRANIPAVAFTSRWTDEVVKQLNIHKTERKATLKEFLGRDISSLTPTAKQFQDTFTEDWDTSSFKELTDIKKLGQVPITAVQLATSIRRSLVAMQLSTLSQEGNFQQIGYDLLACTGFISAKLFVTTKIVEMTSFANRIEFNIKYKKKKETVVTIPDLIVWRLLTNNNLEAKATFGTEIKTCGSFDAALNQICGESLALTLHNYMRGLANPDGSSTIDFIRLHGMEVGFTTVHYPPGYLNDILNFQSPQKPASLVVCEKSFSLLSAAGRSELFPALCTLAEKYEK